MAMNPGVTLTAIFFIKRCIITKSRKNEDTKVKVLFRCLVDIWYNIGILNRRARMEEVDIYES